jgi:hypothetical protein
MRVKAGTIAGILVVLNAPLPMFPASATASHESTILPLRSADDDDVSAATAIDPPKVDVSSLNVPTVPPESRTEKRSAPSLSHRRLYADSKELWF